MSCTSGLATDRAAPTPCSYFRPAEVDLLHGDSTKAEQKLGWKRQVTFDQLVKEMVEADMHGASALSKATIPQR